MSRSFFLQIILPIDGYDEGKIYKSEEIELKKLYRDCKPDNVYYRCLKEKSAYASSSDIIAFVQSKYSLEKMSNWSMRKNYHGGCEIEFEGNRYVVEDVELKQLEKEHIDEAVYCNELISCSLDWFYTSIGSELVSDYFSIVDDELIQKAAALLGYKSEKDIAMGLVHVIEDDAYGDDKFISSLILVKEIANRMNGKAILWYD